MTVCVAAYHHRSRAIVTVSDSMLANEYSALEANSVKFYPLAGQEHRWYCLFADQPSIFSSLHRHTLERLIDLEGDLDIDTVKDAVRAAYEVELDRQIREVVLGPLAMTREQFRDDGLMKLGAEIFARKVKELEDVRVPVQLIVFGFGSAGLAHIFSVDDRGQCSERDVEGVHAIGSGSWAALGSLYPKRGFLFAKTLGEVVYHLCEAKFASETSRYVGEETNVFVLFQNGKRLFMGGEATADLRSLWEKRFLKRPPTQTLRVIEKELLPWEDVPD
jgi:hypothetical protein